MTKPPFGFNPSGEDDDDDAIEKASSGSADTPSGPDQSGMPFGFGFPGLPGMPGGMQFPPGMQFPDGQVPDMSALMPMFEQLQRLFSGASGGPVNWDLAKQTAIQAARTKETGTTGTTPAIEQAIHIADLWLGDKTIFSSGVKRVESWSRTRWIELTLPVWSQLCDPVAAKMVAAMSSLLPTDGLADMPGMGNLPGIEGILSQMGGMMFGSQVGQALAHLSSEVLTSTDVGLPLGPEGVAVLLPQNVTEFASGLGQSTDDVQLFIALREAAYHRLFAGVPWLKKKLLGTIEAYAAGIVIDKDAIERAVSELDPEELQANPQKMQEIMSSGVFEPQQTESQKQQLAALETLLALIEGWVDRVVLDAADDRLPAARSIAEMIRRRRATGGPAEQTFATLVGLELRPRRLREAAALWEQIEKDRGIDGRDAIWAHPDLLPTSSDLDNPAGFALGSSEDSFTDADFEALLRGEPPAKPTEDDDKQ